MNILGEGTSGTWLPGPTLALLFIPSLVDKDWRFCPVESVNRMATCKTGYWIYLIGAHILKGPKLCAETNPRAALTGECTEVQLSVLTATSQVGTPRTKNDALGKSEEAQYKILDRFYQRNQAFLSQCFSNEEAEVRQMPGEGNSHTFHVRVFSW